MTIDFIIRPIDNQVYFDPMTPNAVRWLVSQDCPMYKGGILLPHFTEIAIKLMTSGLTFEYKI